MKTQEHTAGPWEIDEEMEGDVMACGELLASAYPMKHDGLHESWKANARLIAAAPQLLEALEQIECPDCNHILKYHADKYGCEVDRGDIEIGGMLQASGPCGCNAEYGATLEHTIPDIFTAIQAIRSAKGETL